MTAWSTVATAVLVLIALVLALVAGNTWMEIQRKQAEELARVRYEIAELRRQQPDAMADSETGPIAKIGASTQVFQVGDRVEVIDGTHRGDHGTIAPAPDWLREGYVRVDLVREGAQAYMPVSKLALIDRASTD